jgi:hypothetical protein
MSVWSIKVLSSSNASGLMSNYFCFSTGSYSVTSSPGWSSCSTPGIVLSMLDFFQRLLPEDHHAIGQLDGVVTAFQ